MYDFSQYIDSDLQSSIAAMFGVLAVFGIVGLALYILKAIGVYKMGKTAGVANPWIAFIPVINCFTLGRLAEKYVKRDGSRSAKFGVILLILRIVSTILAMVLCIVFTGSLISLILQAADSDTIQASDVLGALTPSAFLYFFTLAVSLAFKITHYVALWRVYNAFDYGNGTLFTVLVIIFNFLEGIFLFVLRNKQPVFDYRDRFTSFAAPDNTSNQA